MTLQSLAKTSLLLLSLTSPALSLPGPTDISNTYTTPNPLLNTLQHLRRQFTGGALISGFAGPPPDRCYHRPDKLPACPYGGQCRPDQRYTCDTYCQNYGKDFDNRFSCNLPCSYESTTIDGSASKPRNPMHCGTPSERSPLKCESGWACYRQFSEVGPAFEQRGPVCSPKYEFCKLQGVEGMVDNATVGAVTEKPLLSLSIPSAEMAAENEGGEQPASSSSEETETNSTSNSTSPLAKRQLLDSCSAGLTCLEDPRPSLGLPPNQVARIGICVAIEASKTCDQRVWDSCGEEGLCAKDPGRARDDLAAPGYCVRLLGEDWKTGSSLGLGLERRGLVRRC